MCAPTSFVLILYIFSIFIGKVHSIPSCTSDKDCSDGAKCYTFIDGLNTVSRCTMNTESIPMCSGTKYGYCPFVDDEMQLLMCAFTKRKSLKPMPCCSDRRRRLERQGTGVSTELLHSDSVSRKLVETTSTTSDENTTTTTTTTSTDTNCYECFLDPVAFNTTVYGQYECIPYSQCNDKAAFTDACGWVDKMCKTGTDELCSQRGTCTLSESDKPITSYKCACRPGFSGGLCDKVLNDDCIFDCGVGGKCNNGTCKCNPGHTGKQCFGCTANTTCNSELNQGYCDTSNKMCKCMEGYTLPFCNDTQGNGPVDICSIKSCGNQGQCINGECYCLGEDCSDTSCKKCSNDNCSKCSTATALSMNHLVVFVIVTLTGVYIF